MSIVTAPSKKTVVRPPNKISIEEKANRFEFQSAPPKIQRRLIPGKTLMVVLGLILAGTVSRLFYNPGSNSETLILHTVELKDLTITVTERGNLESQDSIEIVCQVEDVERDGIHGTPILSIVENGSSVKKGELIVELDGTNHRNRVDEQFLELEEEAKEAKQARVQYENQKNQNQTRLQQAQLQVDLADLAVKQFEDEKGGTFQIELQGIELLLHEAEASRLIEKTNLNGVKQLYELGYRSSSELAEARLNALKSERELATALSKKRELVQYVYKKSRLELDGALATAKQDLRQVLLDNEADLEDALASLTSAEKQLKKEKELLERYETQLENCKIYAPQDGMVAYSTGTSRYHREEIRAGAPVRPQQTIMTIPNLQRMEVKTSIHESVLDQVKVGLQTTVHVDAFADSHYSGTVHSVAVLPDSGGWAGSDTKVYTTVVRIEDDVEFIKPGMTAVVEIHVDRLSDIIAVPIQAVTQQDGETYCFVQSGHDVERRLVEVGATNDKFVEVTSGLSLGDEVVLNPSAVTDDASNAEMAPSDRPNDSEADAADANESIDT